MLNWLYGTTPTPKVTRKYGWNHNETLSEEEETKFTYKVMNYHPNLGAVKEVDLRNTHIEVYDQGQLGSCTSNGWCYCYEFEMLKQNEEYIQMSRLMHYYNERVLNNTVETDSGAQIKDGADVLMKKGMTIESLWPYVIEKFAENPPQNCWDDMQYHMGTKVERVKKTIKDIKQCLIDGYPVVFGFRVYESFEETGADGIVKIPDVKKEKLLGGHCVVCVGFKMINDKEYFIIRNSWSSSWADHGFCYFPTEFMVSTSGVFGRQELCSDFWTVKKVCDVSDPNVVETDEQKLEHVKKMIGVDSSNNDLEELFNGIKSLVGKVELKKSQTTSV